MTSGVPKAWFTIYFMSCVTIGSHYFYGIWTHRNTGIEPDSILVTCASEPIEKIMTFSHDISHTIYWVGLAGHKERRLDGIATRGWISCLTNTPVLCWALCEVTSQCKQGCPVVNGVLWWAHVLKTVASSIAHSSKFGEPHGKKSSKA